METTNQNEEPKTQKAATHTRERKGLVINQDFEQALEQTFESELDAEIANSSMFAKYEINTKFIELMNKEPLVGTITKVPGFRGAEELVIRTKILRWTKDVKPKNQDDKDYLAFKGVNSVFSGTLGELIGNKSKRPYWGIRFDLGNGDSLNYALTYGDFRILSELKVFRLREVAQ